MLNIYCKYVCNLFNYFVKFFFKQQMKVIREKMEGLLSQVPTAIGNTRLSIHF